MSLTIMPDVAHSATDFHLDDQRLAALWDTENRHFWHPARNAWILLALDHYLHHCKASILDVGCGSGGVARALVGAGHQVTGIDTAESLVRRAHLRVPQARFVCGELSRLHDDFAGPYDVIAFFDVLEHLDAPGRLLRSAMRFAQSGSLVMATVPAQMRLFSDVDIASGHKRRYELNELSVLFREAGLREIHEYGIFRILSALLKLHRRPVQAERPQDLAKDPGWANDVLLRDIRVPSAFINASARIACAIEQRLFLRSESKLGASLLVVGRVP